MRSPKTPAKLWLAGEITEGQKTARLPIILGAAQIACGILQAFCAAKLLAACFLPATRTQAAIATLAAGFALLAAARAAIQYRAERAGFERGAAARHRLRTKIFAALLAAGPAALREKHTAELAAIAIDRVEVFQNLHAAWIPATTLAFIGPALVALAAYAADWRCGLILTIAGLAVPIGMAAAGIGAGLAASKQFSAMTRLQIRFLDRIRGISTIVLAGRTADEAAALAKAAEDLRKRTMRVLRIAFLSSTTLDLAAAAALIAVVIRFLPILHGEPALIPTALFLLLLTPEFFAPLRAFSAVYQDRMAAEAVAPDFAALQLTESAAPPAPLRTITTDSITLAFDNVGFSWGDTKILENLSFRVGRGEILLLTGASGSGKSTILDLVLGFITPQSGKILVNGQDIATLIPTAREKLIGWIGQKPAIFGGTIRDNILFAKPDATSQDLAKAIRRAHLSTVIAALPAGLDTQIGDAGFGLSGGQAQRIAIARAFLKDAPLLVMDEPTAHLDPTLEKDILESLKSLAAGRTVILATHSTLAQDFASATGARRLDLDARKNAKCLTVA